MRKFPPLPYVFDEERNLLLIAGKEYSIEFFLLMAKALEEPGRLFKSRIAPDGTMGLTVIDDLTLVEAMEKMARAKNLQ